jgi:hypothetical protein
MDAADAFWAASLVSRFSDEMIRAIVDTGELSDAAAAKQLGDIIIKRRDKVVAYWMTRTNPLDRFRVTTDNDDPRLHFENAAVRLRLADAPTDYEVAWAAFDNNTGSGREIVRLHTQTTSSLLIPMDAFGPADAFGARYAVATIRTQHGAFPEWQSPIRVTLRASRGSFDVVGVERSTTQPHVKDETR